MRCHLRKKVQFAVGSTQPGKEIALGEFPAAEAADRCRPLPSDSAEADGERDASGCDHGDGFHSGACEFDSPRGGSIAARMLIAMIKVYQWTLSPLLPNCCRFEPSCSRYAVEALRVHGFLRGFFLSFRRVLRCQPFCQGGIDPVPPPRSVPKLHRKGGQRKL